MDQERRQSERFAPTESITVYDAVTGRPIGTLATLSSEGGMFLTDTAVPQGSILHCRVELEKPIHDSRVIRFDAECRWCRKNISQNRWESGYLLTAHPGDSYRLSLLVLGFKLGQWGNPNIPDVASVDLDYRRKSARFEFTPPLPVFDQSSYRQLGDLTDLSIGGCRLVSDRILRPDEATRCRVKLPVPMLGRDYLMLTLSCRWCHALSNLRRFESGHTLEVMSSIDASLVLRLLINYGKPLHEPKRIGIVP